MIDLTEIEPKLGIPDETVLEWVRSGVGPGHIAQQDNRFFDRRDHTLRNRHIGARLRSQGRCKS